MLVLTAACSALGAALLAGAALATLSGSPEQTPPQTGFSREAGAYAQLLEGLRARLLAHQRVRRLGGRDRTVYVPWIRDQIHVVKAMKYLTPDVSSLIEFYLENQTGEGLYYDYYSPIDSGDGSRLALFSPRYWKVFPKEKIQMHRLPVEADLEYLMVEGAYHVWQSTGDRAFLEKWIPALAKGMHYAMSDPLRWSRKYLLVKRGYTLDTWDFMQLPATREEYTRQGHDVQKGIFDIGPDTPMGIMHGDNSGMYAASRQLAAMFRALGHETDANIWDHQAELFRLRTNRLCWNGRYYSHFVEDDAQPAYLKMDQRNTLSLSNPYDVNRGLPTEEMAESIIRTYLELREKEKSRSIAEWYGIFPPVEPHFADYKPGSYMNGGVNTIVAGELAKAALQHGYESYGVDILRRVKELMDRHNGDLPVAYRPDGAVDEGIPDNWGQAAVFSALIEGLAGIVDRTRLFGDVEVSPRWLAAGVDNVKVTIAYGPSGKHVTYEYNADPTARMITLRLSGDPERYAARVLLPEGATDAAATVDGRAVTDARIERVRRSPYVVIPEVGAGAHTIVVKYRA